MEAGTEREGTVLRVDARACTVWAGGREVQARMRGRLFERRGEDSRPLAVGDRVLLNPDSEEGTAIEAVCPRRNLLARRAAGEDVKRQVVAANLDQVVVVASFGNPAFSSLTTDRILASAAFHDLPAAVVLNKVDLAAVAQRDAVSATYAPACTTVLLTSATRGDGIEDFARLLRGNVSVLAGLSGVGKSTLLNAIQPGLGLRTREVSRSLRSGRHTTSFARMFPLEMGGAVVDTPGVRVFRLYGIPPGELRLHFPELERLGAACRFSSCTHREEPGCAVAAALEAGQLPRSRYRSYLEILGELEGVYGGTGRTGD